MDSVVLEVFSSTYESMICAPYPSFSLLIAKLKQQGVVGMISTVVLCVLSETSETKWSPSSCSDAHSALGNPKSDSGGI